MHVNGGKTITHKQMGQTDGKKLWTSGILFFDSKVA